MAAEITKTDVDAIYGTVAKTIADALGCELDESSGTPRCIDDLGAESIDFLDLVFRLERAFKVKIPRGKIVEDARGDLPRRSSSMKGVVTRAGSRGCARSSPKVPPTARGAPLRPRTSRGSSPPRRSRS